MIFHGIFSAVCNVLASLVLGIAVFSRKPREPKTLTFAWMMVNVAVWSALYFCWMIARSPADALFYCRALSAAAITIPVCYYHFTTRLTGRARNREVLAGYAGAVVLAGLCATPWMVDRVEPNRWFPFWPKPGWLYPLYLAFFFGFFLRLTLLLWVEFRRAAFLRRNQLLYVLVFTLAGFLGGSTNYFLWYGLPVPPVGNLLVAIYMIGVGYAVIRFRLMEFNLLIARIVGYTLLVLALAGAQTVLALAIARWLDPGENHWLTLFTEMLVFTAGLLGLTPALRARMDGFLEQRVFGRNLELRARLLRLPQHLSALKDEEAIFAETVAAVAATLEAERVALFLRFEFEVGFRPRAATGWPAGGPPPTWADGQRLLQLLQHTPQALLLDELEHTPGDPNRDAIARVRREQQIELIVPVRTGTFFYGFLALGCRREKRIFNATDISLLEAVALQVGLNLRSRQLERQANQAEKLISLGTLAAGLAHELRNPLVSIRTFCELMAEQGGDPEFRHDFRAVVARDVQRIGAIIEHVAAFAENSTVKFTPVRLDAVIQAVYEIARPEFDRAGVRFVAPISELPAVSGNYGQLLQVFLNLFQNAIHALQDRPGALVEVRAQVRDGEAGGRSLQLAVSDNGPGIEAELRARIFEPFITTKATGDSQAGRRGMGLGLAIVRRIVEGHHGAISVTSEPGHGTTFHVHLPCLP